MVYFHPIPIASILCILPEKKTSDKSDVARAWKTMDSNFIEFNFFVGHTLLIDCHQLSSWFEPALKFTLSIVQGRGVSIHE